MVVYKRYPWLRKTLRPKIKCEICGVENKKILERHHIIPRSDPRCTDKNDNIALICPNCHTSVHLGEVIIIGVYPTTDGPKLMWFKRGQEAPLAEEFWLVRDNPRVLTLGLKTE
jgi:hypothetical protein